MTQGHHTPMSERLKTTQHSNLRYPSDHRCTYRNEATIKINHQTLQDNRALTAPGSAAARLRGNHPHQKSSYKAR